MRASLQLALLSCVLVIWPSAVTAETILVAGKIKVEIKVQKDGTIRASAKSRSFGAETPYTYALNGAALKLKEMGAKYFMISKQAQCGSWTVNGSPIGSAQCSLVVQPVELDESLLRKDSPLPYFNVEKILSTPLPVSP